MKIGDYVTIDEVKQQSIYRWIVLVDLDFSAPYDGLTGGVIKYIEDSKSKAGIKKAALGEAGVDAILICGASDELSVGGVFVE